MTDCQETAMRMLVNFQDDAWYLSEYARQAASYAIKARDKALDMRHGLESLEKVMLGGMTKEQLEELFSHFDHYAD